MSYESSYPANTAVNSNVIQFFKDFYSTSDTPGAHDDYVDFFTEDATFKIGSKQANGREQILATRHGMWAAVASRRHTIPKIFPFGEQADEFMLYGTVALGLKNGGESELEWAGRAQFVKCDDGKLRMKYYQVYLDTGASTAYKK